MAVYAVGDLQGCLTPLQRLLDRLGFDSAGDRLWLCGDLVNRGPQSAATLRFLRGLGEAVISVLGNHDLHLLACAADPGRLKRRDTLRPVLDAADAAELIDWLRGRPLLHHDPALGYTMVHAGLPPQWDLAQAQACADEFQALLRGSQLLPFLAVMYGNQPDRWDPRLHGDARLRFIANALTRMRYVDAHGRLALAHKGAPGSQPPGLLPWFRHPQRASRGQRIVFGHWSTLGLHQEDGVSCLDSGCLWGERLSALRLDVEPAQLTQVDCPQEMRPNRFTTIA